jgi:hypothetical protein
LCTFKLSFTPDQISESTVLLHCAEKTQGSYSVEASLLRLNEIIHAHEQWASHPEHKITCSKYPHPPRISSHLSVVYMSPARHLSGRGGGGGVRFGRVRGR